MFWKESDKPTPQCPPGVIIRSTVDGDAPHLLRWLSDPETVRWFPMGDPPEIEGAVPHWMSFVQYNACLTAEIEGQPCGMAIVFLQMYQKLKHQAMHVIVVDPAYRRRGIGSALLEEMHCLAKDRLEIELIHTEIFEGCPALDMYLKHGYEIFGTQEKWIKDNREYLGRILLERLL